jgi:hypothetical protein
VSRFSSLEALRANRRIRRAEPARQVPAREAELDALLKAHVERKEELTRASEAGAALAPVEQFRQEFEVRYVPAIKELAEGLAEREIGLVVDASDFVGGGRLITIEMIFEGCGSRLEGTFLSEEIAFQETRIVHANKIGGGRLSGGPMLRLRDLSPDAFADFIYGRVVKLVQLVARG